MSNLYCFNCGTEIEKLLYGKKKCRSCYNSYMNEYMNKRYAKRRAEWIERLGGVCIDCGTSDDLEFDHNQSSSKEYSVARIIAGASKTKLEKEMSKCVLRCFFCHLTKSQLMRDVKFVDHGEGLTGKRGCSCELCRPLKTEYMRQWRVEKRAL